MLVRMEKGVGVKFLVQNWSEMGEGNMKEGLKTRFEMGGGAPPDLCLRSFAWCTAFYLALL